MIPWQNIDTLFLDMDGTLLDLHFDNYFWNEYLPRRYAEIRDLPVAAASELLNAHYERKLGTLDWYCVDYWSDTLQLDIHSLKREVTSLIRYRDHAPAFLDFVTSRCRRTLIVTNAHPSIVALKDEFTQLCERVDGVICSHELGLPKEEPAFWQALHSIEPFDATRTLLVDDNHDVLDAADAHGIRHLLAIEQPDSHKPVVEPGRFTAVADFAALIEN